jgi:hypothetical protein
MAQVFGKIGAGEGNRTLVISLEGFCSTIELHPQNERSGSHSSARYRRANCRARILNAVEGSATAPVSARHAAFLRAA